jgi:hypothetical protein
MEAETEAEVEVEAEEEAEEEEEWVERGWPSILVRSSRSRQRECLVEVFPRVRVDR